MKPPPFAYSRAESVDEAVSILAEHGADAKILAGGQSLVPMLNFRLASPSLLVDVNRIPGLSGIEEGRESVGIGALTRHREIEHSGVVRRCFPVLSEAVRHVAHPAIRNRGTLGGSLAHADPAARVADDGAPAGRPDRRVRPRWRAPAARARILPIRARHRPSRRRNGDPRGISTAAARCRLGLRGGRTAGGGTSPSRRSPRRCGSTRTGRWRKPESRSWACTIHPFGSIGRRRGLPERR